MSVIFSERNYWRLLGICPVSLLLFGLFWIVAGVGFTWGIFSASPEERIVPRQTPEKALSILEHGQTIKRTLRFQVSGPGRATGWEPELIRHFDFVKELTYTSKWTGSGAPEVTERRTLNRFRFLLLSSPASHQPDLRWDVTKILDRFGSPDSLLKFGRKGAPVSPIKPESLSEKERSFLLNYVRGNGRGEQGAGRKLIRFISPYEGEEFDLRHTIQNGAIRTSFSRPSEVAGLERDVLLHAPVLPGMFMPDRHISRRGTSSSTDFSPAVVISGFGMEHYLRPFFRCRMEGAVQFQKNGRKGNFTGAGSFNLYDDGHTEQIGEIQVKHISVEQNKDTGIVKKATLRGRISITRFPERHLLRHVRFLQKPTFRIQFSTEVIR